MDNKPLEEQAESYIKSQLLKFGFKVMKPSFDKKGADLIIIDSIDKKYSKFLIVQSKGRLVPNKGSTMVKIPKKYVEKNFTLFIYTLDEEKNESVFFFSAEDIQKWNNNDDDYILNIYKEKLQESYFTEKIFNGSLANVIYLMLSQTEIKHYTSVIIDGTFLQRAFDKTVTEYSKIWPEKKFIRPNLNSIIKNILDCYDKYNTEDNEINCYLLLNESLSLESRIDINKINHDFITNKGKRINIFINTTNEILGLKVLQQLERLINNDNIILIADDRVYETALNNLKDKGVEIIVVMFNEHDGSEMLINFKWGDITYPIGISIGLQKNEL